MTRRRRKRQHQKRNVLNDRNSKGRMPGSTVTTTGRKIREGSECREKYEEHKEKTTRPEKDHNE